MDIVERLRICAKYDPDQAEGADEIERLRDELKFADEIRQSALQSLFGAEKEIERLRENAKQNVELVEALMEALEIAADGFRDCGAEDLEDMCRAVIAINKKEVSDGHC